VKPSPKALKNFQIHSSGGGVVGIVGISFTIGSHIGHFWYSGHLIGGQVGNFGVISSESKLLLGS